jgi:hypothetical protein
MITNEEERRHFFDDVSDVPDHLLRDWIERIRSGERGKKVDGYATYAIRDFWLRQSLGHEQSPVVLQWLADVLDSATEHRNPKELMSQLGLLPRPAYRPADPQRAIDVAWWIRSAQRLGYTSAEAVELAAACFSVDAKTVQRYRARANDWADGMSADAETWARYFLASSPPRPLPPPKDKK